MVAFRAGGCASTMCDQIITNDDEYQLEYQLCINYHCGVLAFGSLSLICIDACEHKYDSSRHFATSSP